MSDFSLSFGQKRVFPAFFKQIDALIDIEISQLESSAPKPPYYNIWKQWKSKNLLSLYGRNSIAKVILNRSTPVHHEKPGTTMELVMNKLRKVIPLLDIKYTFKPSDRDDDVYIIMSTDKKPSSQQQVSQWVTPKNPVKQSTSYKSAVTNSAQTVTTSNNTYEVLNTGTLDNPIVNLEDDDNDEGLSYDTSPTDSLKDKATEKTVSATVSKDNDEATAMKKGGHISKLTTTDDDNNTDNDDDSDDAYLAVYEAIQDRTVDKLDINLLARWIEHTTANIHTSDRLLNEHKDIVMDKLERRTDWLAVDIKNQVTNYINTETEQRVINLKTQVTDYVKNEAEKRAQDLKKLTRALRTELDEKIDTVSRHQSTIKNDTQSMVDKISSKISKATTEIEKCETESIMMVTTKGNDMLQHLNDKIQSVTALSAKINEDHITAKHAKDDVVAAIRHLRTTVEELYDRFSDDISKLADNERDLFRDFLVQKQRFIDEHHALSAELRNERDLLQAERKAMRREQELLTKQRVDFEQWSNEMRAKTLEFDKWTNELQSTHSTSTPHRTTHNRSAPKFSSDEPIHYVTANYNVYGYIMNTVPPNFENGSWKYAIYTGQGNKIYDCDESCLTHVKDHIPTDYVAPPTPAAIPPSHTSPMRTSRNMHNEMPSFQHFAQNERVPEYPRTNHRPWMSRHNHSKVPANEFVYPHGTPSRQIYALPLYKAAQYWTLKIKGESDLRGFYDRLKGHLEYYNILLCDYDNIQRDQPIVLITPENCENYEYAVNAMSKCIFQLFDQYSSDFFSTYVEPLGYIESFRPKMDGLGFLKHIMKKRHPNLRDVDALENVLPTTVPTMDECPTIFNLINRYMEWLHDEKLRNNRMYTNYEQIQYILTQLDDDLYATAKKSIKDELAGLQAHGNNPKPFPSHLLVDENLGLYIIGLLPKDVQTAIYASFSSYIQQDDAKVNKVKSSDKQRPYKPRQDRDDKWVDEIKWEILPGEQCPACLKSNHNVYKTGCPTFATFAVCNEFNKTVPPDRLKQVTGAYRKYQRELNKQKRERRNNDKRTLRHLQAEYHGEDIAQLKKTMFNAYVKDFQDEQYCTENPYDDLDPETLSDHE